MNSQPNDPQQLLLWEMSAATSPNIQRDASQQASIEKPALDPTLTLLDEIVDEVTIEMAWARVKANRGAPGHDGITIADFPEWFRPRWENIRRQLLEGTYRPQPARRVWIEKPGGGTRELGIPNLLDRLIQTAIVLALTPIFDPKFRSRVLATAHYARLKMQSSKCKRSSAADIVIGSIWTCQSSLT